MHRVIYLDSYFLLNLFMDAAALLITARILSKRTAWYRVALSAALGAGASLLPVVFPGVVSTVVAAAFLFPMVLLAFGWGRGRDFFLACFFYFLSSLVLGGAVEALYWLLARTDAMRRVTPGIFLFCFCIGFGCFSLWGKSARRRLEETVISITVRRGDAQADLYALVDSGSFLKEPVSGFPVILMKASAARSLFTPTELNALSRGDAEAGLPLVAVPVKTASGSSVLFGFRPTLVGLHHKAFRRAYRETDRAVVALDFSDGAFAGCSCLVPLTLI